MSMYIYDMWPHMYIYIRWSITFSCTPRRWYTSTVGDLHYNVCQVES